jgi:NitT/TauT family transport system permease protein
MARKNKANGTANRFSYGTLVLVLGFLMLWEAGSRLGLISRMFFPPPSTIVTTLVSLIANGRIVDSARATLNRLVLGSLLGITPGILLGVLMGWSRRLRALFDPLIAATHPIPKISIFPLILIIFGIGEISIVIVIAISAFFPALVTSMTGVAQLDQVYFEVAKNYGASRWKTFSRILLPGSLPSILSGVRLGLTTALLLTIAVELLSAKQGLGVMIWFSWQTLRVEELFATLVVVALLGIVINSGLRILFTRLAPWSPEHSAKTSTTVK